MSLIRARVYRSSKREFDCKIDDTGEIVPAKALGNLLKGADTIVVGDYVLLEKAENLELYHIVELEPRKNEIFRILVRESKKKVTAANCDVMVILTSVSRPQYKQGVVDRFLVRACQWEAVPFVVFNKMDEYDENEFDINFEQDRLRALGVQCFEISAKFDDYQKKYLELGFDELSEKLKGQSAIFLGQSGVGKSKAINRLAGGEIELRTKAVGKKSGKGSHTTTWSEIVDCNQFTLIDSPGVRSFSLEDIDKDDLMSYFPDIADMAASCKFRDCNHEIDAKGCAFRENLDPDEYDTKLILSRLESYQRIYQEVSAKENWEKKI